MGGHKFLDNNAISQPHPQKIDETMTGICSANVRVSSVFLNVGGMLAELLDQKCQIVSIA